MSDVLAIGSYQLENLLKNGVHFHFFDLSERSDVTTQHPLLAGSARFPEGSVLEEINRLSLSKDAPIVLICEQGPKSMAVAQILSENSFLNVYVVQGGTAAL